MGESINISNQEAEDNKFRQWLGKDYTIGYDICNNKYRFNNESFEDFLERVSGGDKELKELIREKKFMFGGRTTANRGTGKKGSYSNCYSVGYVKDDLTDIMQVAKDIALTFKTQGGQGLSLSKLRPKGCGINKGQFKSDGIIPFMEIYNRVTESISQGGSRKGALLMSLDIWHKESKDFITIKSDEDKIQKANLSLEIDDEFMNMVKEYYETGEVKTKHITKNYNGNKCEYDITPIELYKLMMEKAYDWAEPGCLFTNRFRNYNIMQNCDDYQIETCNPCVSGDTLILTDDGYIEIEKLVNTPVNIWNGYEWSNVVPEVTGTNQPMKFIEFSDGATLRCTHYHKFILSDGSRVEAKDLKIGDQLIKNEFPLIDAGYDLSEKLMYTKGFLAGDGTLSTSGGIEKTYIYLYGPKQDLLPYLDYTSLAQLPNDDNRCMITLDRRKYRIGGKFYVPGTGVSIQSRLNWLAGIIDSDGTLNNQGGSIAITSIVPTFLRQIKLMLNTLGCTGTIGVLKPNQYKEMPDGNGGMKEYYCQTSYRLTISAYYVRQLMNLGLRTHRVPLISNVDKCKSKYIKVKNMINDGIEPVVYCVNEPKNHSVVFNGLITSNCGEQSLPANGACNLGSIDVSKFVTDEFTDKASFDYYSFSKAIVIAIRSLDKVVDENANNHALQSQKKMAMNYRNIGLGIMGLWDALCKLQLKYGSKEAIDFTKKMIKHMFKSSVYASNDLAESLGTFPKYSEDVFKSDIMINAFSDEEINKLKVNGLRNCSLLSIAPTGSIGTMFNVSTGCEPAFAISYNRKTISLHGEEEKTYKVYTGLAKEYMVRFNTDKLPDYFVSSGDINWKDRIDMQSMLQNYVDTAISSTINLPKETTVEEIEQLYLYAWKKGLKGVTIYRDQCKRSGILTKTEDISEDKQPNALYRGEVIKVSNNTIGKERHLMTGCGSLHCTAFFDPKTGELLESYLSKGSTGGCQSNLAAVSRLISLSARAGVSVYDIADQLDSCMTCPSYAVRTATKHDTSIGSCCPVAVGKVLIEMYEEFQNEIKPKETIKEEDAKDTPKKENKTSINTCPECGSELKHEGGCISCKNCYWSKCE